MPLRIQCGWSRKAGLPDYSSVGASVHLDLEVDSDVVRQPRELRRKLEYLFEQARQAVDAELHAPESGTGGDRHEGNGHNGTPDRSNGHANGSSPRPATASQCKAIRAIANRQRVDLGLLLRGEYHVEKPEDLGIADASAIIDRLKASANGSGGRR